MSDSFPYATFLRKKVRVSETDTKQTDLSDKWFQISLQNYEFFIDNQGVVKKILVDLKKYYLCFPRDVACCSQTYILLFIIRCILAQHQSHRKPSQSLIL